MRDDLLVVIAAITIALIGGLVFWISTADRTVIDIRTLHKERFLE